MTHSSVAILVDADNVSSALAGQILRISKDLGPKRMRLAFCNTQSLTDWASAPSFRTIHAGNGKNSTDILLSIRAVELALRDGIDAFVIVSSDADLSHAAHRLRELGCHVLGLGEDKAPERFRYACSEFAVLTPPPARIDAASLDDIDKAVRSVLAEHDPNRRGIPVSRLNGLVRANDKSIKISEQPERTWPRYLAKRPEYYQVTGDGPLRMVRLASATNNS